MLTGDIKHDLSKKTRPFEELSKKFKIEEQDLFSFPGSCFSYRGGFCITAVGEIQAKNQGH